MSWTDHYKKGVLHLKSNRLEDALKDLTQALSTSGGNCEHVIYSSRAAAYERQGKLKEALQDVRKVVKLAPDHWQGYARAARLFVGVGRLNEATAMADMALCRLDSNDAKRRRKLNELKDEVLEHRRRCVYHFGKLPVEIITVIFEMVISSDWSRILVIAGVSKHWRDIALNTASLWSTLVLTNRHPARHAQRWIERSRGRIRELSLRSSLAHAPVNFHGLLWNHLRICKLEDHDIAEYVGGNPKLHLLSELEELEVNATFHTVNCDLLLSIPDTHTRRLNLNGAPFSWHILSVHHRNLTSLVIRNNPREFLRLNELRDILESNPTLEQLVLDLESFERLSPPLPTPLTLSHLRFLCLGGMDWASHFFDIATMPCLHTLQLVRIRGVRLTPLIERRPPLTQLSIHCCIVPSSQLLEFLDLTPTLKTLELVRLDGTSNLVIEALAARCSQSPVESSSTPSAMAPLCPLLSAINLSHCPDVRTGPIVRLLKFRNCEVSTDVVDSPVVARIRSLKVDGCPQIEAGSIPWIRAQVKVFSCIYLTKKAANWKR
ncbi:hypothetical protein B0H10DRAFT_1886607 [Mycena sp. CBHHK59/15]|nr:hypothetical protein B0H10DRAFT_1886607 [Mycena sp. CBHHK59/15]